MRLRPRRNLGLFARSDASSPFLLAVVCFFSSAGGFGYPCPAPSGGTISSDNCLGYLYCSAADLSVPGSQPTCGGLGTCTSPSLSSDSHTSNQGSSDSSPTPQTARTTPVRTTSTTRRRSPSRATSSARAATALTPATAPRTSPLSAVAAALTSTTPAVPVSLSPRRTHRALASLPPRALRSARVRVVPRSSAATPARRRTRLARSATDSSASTSRYVCHRLRGRSASRPNVLTPNPRPQSNIEQCGACASEGGVDCTTLEGVSAVGCVAGSCEIWSCEDGFTYDPTSSVCVASS